MTNPMSTDGPSVLVCTFQHAVEHIFYFTIAILWVGPCASYCTMRAHARSRSACAYAQCVTSHTNESSIR